MIAAMASPKLFLGSLSTLDFVDLKCAWVSLRLFSHIFCLNFLPLLTERSGKCFMIRDKEQFISKVLPK